MYVGGFHRVNSKEEITNKVPSYPGSSIIYVENENKLYEKNSYGMINDYHLITPPPTNNRYDFTDEIADFENRIYNLEQQVEKIGGRYEV